MAAVIHDAALAVLSLVGLAALTIGCALPVLYYRAARVPEHEEGR